jgi:hypothetical protein
MTTVTLDRFLPKYDKRELHSKYIAADPATVWTALHEATTDDLPITRVLMRIRTGGKTKLNGPLLGSRPALQPLSVTEGVELVSGMISQYWRLIPDHPDVPRNNDAFIAFNQPGWIKLGIDFRLTPEGDGTRLSTETRCVATDGKTLLAFQLYWAFIRLFSGFVRIEILQAVAKLAERKAAA